MFNTAWNIGRGDPPPKWLMKEFKKALHLMAQNREAVHLFDGNQVTFIIAIAAKDRATDIAQVIGDAIAGKAVESVPPRTGEDS